MSEKCRLGRKIGFQNTFYTKCINVIIDNIGPLIILRSIYSKNNFQHRWSCICLKCDLFFLSVLGVLVPNSRMSLCICIIKCQNLMKWSIFFLVYVVVNMFACVYV